MPTVWIINDILVLILTTYTYHHLHFLSPLPIVPCPVQWMICAAFPHLGMHFCHEIKVPSLLQGVTYWGMAGDSLWLRKSNLLKRLLFICLCVHMCVCMPWRITCGTLFSPSPTESLTHVARLVGKHLSHRAILSDRNTTSLKWQCSGDLLPKRSAPEDTRFISNDSFLTVAAEPLWRECGEQIMTALLNQNTAIPTSPHLGLLKWSFLTA